MPRYKMVTYSNAKPGQDDELNRWFDTEHMCDLLAMDGVVSGERFRLINPDANWIYGVMLEFDCDDPIALMNEIVRRSIEGEISLTDALDLESVQMSILEPYRSDSTTKTISPGY